MALFQDASPFRQGDSNLMLSFPIAYPLSEQKAIFYLQMIPLGTQAVISSLCIHVKSQTFWALIVFYPMSYP